MVLGKLLDYFDQFTVDNANPPDPKGVTNAIVVDRNLDQRSFLDFKFPKKAEGGPALSVKLPFFENIQITEAKKARYQTYKPISRSSSLYTYLGADSRKLNLTFFLTYHNIQAAPGGVQDYINARSGDSVEEIKRLFKKKSEQPSASQTQTLTSEYRTQVRDSAQQVLGEWGNFLSVTEEQYFATRYGLETGGNIEDIVGQANVTQTTTDQVLTSNQNDAIAVKANLIDMIVYWVNIIRSSVTNNAIDPTLGPPIVRVNHGILYQNIPCICTGYDIAMDNNASMDIDTLLPHRIKVTMTLEEMRTGDFGQFRAGAGEDEPQAISRDNLAGWESVIVHGTMDPGVI